MTEINKGDVINLENGIFIIPNNVEKICGEEYDK